MVATVGTVGGFNPTTGSGGVVGSLGTNKTSKLTSATSPSLMNSRCGRAQLDRDPGFAAGPRRGIKFEIPGDLPGFAEHVVEQPFDLELHASVGAGGDGEALGERGVGRQQKHHGQQSGLHV